MDRQRANVGKVGVARYLTAPPANASQEHQEQQRQRIQERERSASVVVDVSSAHGKELRHLARDPEARKAKLDAERAERDRIDSARERRSRTTDPDTQPDGSRYGSVTRKVSPAGSKP